MISQFLGFYNSSFLYPHRRLSLENRRMIKIAIISRVFTAVLAPIRGFTCRPNNSDNNVYLRV